MDFQGESTLSMDDKNRITIPQKVRDGLVASCAGQLTLVRDPVGCLMVYPRPAWQIKKQEIMDWPMSARDWQRIFLGGAEDVELDSAGRIAVKQELKDWAGIGKKILLRGAGRFYELWDADTWRAREKAVVLTGMPAELASVKF